MIKKEGKEREMIEREAKEMIKYKIEKW